MRVISLAAIMLAGAAACGGAKPAATPTPIEGEADTARAVLMAAMVELPPNMSRADRISAFLKDRCPR